MILTKNYSEKHDGTRAVTFRILTATQFLKQSLFIWLMQYTLKVVERWQRQLQHLTNEHKLVVMQQRIDKYLDQGYGQCLLKNPKIANLVQESLLKYDGDRYKLFAWCVMPNHEHSLC